MPLVALGATVIGGVLSSKASSAQAKSVQDASAASIAEQRRQYDQSRADLAPWREQGGAAINTLGYEMGTAPSTSVPTGQNNGYGSLNRNFSLADFTADPGYEFRLGEGTKALQRSAAARGQLFSGGTLKDLTKYNQDFASNEFNNAYNRFNTNKMNRYNMLSGLAVGGQQATNTTVAAGQNTANNISNNIMNTGEQVGNARASGYAGWGQAINNGANNLLSWYANKDN